MHVIPPKLQSFIPPFLLVATTLFLSPVYHCVALCPQELLFSFPGNTWKEVGDTELKGKQNVFARGRVSVGFCLSLYFFPILDVSSCSLFLLMQQASTGS